MHDPENAIPPTTHLYPPFPEEPDQLDLNLGFVADLALKTLSMDAESTTNSIAQELQLGLVITERVLNQLYRDKLIETKGTTGMHGYRYSMLERGWQRVAHLMELCSYVGPAPVSLELYTEMLVSQVRSRAPVTRPVLDSTLAHLVLPDDVRRTLGVVVSSGRSLFLSGPPGNGKTAMARALVNSIAEPIWIPYAVEVDNQVIRLFDKHVHHPVANQGDGHDLRWVKVAPPLVVVGGELTVESLDLTATESPRFYEAPFQLKANGGVLLVDDFGRQRCSPRQLLNRWIIPLENHVDALTLSTGKKVEIPFEQVVVFATNLTDADLVDAAFMRRMGYRLAVTRPTAELFTEIFRREAKAFGLTVDDALIARLLARYRAEGREPNACDPRDLILRASDLCRFEGRTMEITDEMLGLAWDGYFGKDAVARP